MTSNKQREKSEGLGLLSIVIGAVGCVIITASSVYTALKMGALPWPTIFTSVLSLVILRAFGRRSLNEANVTQIIMSAGSMVAGGLAFTIPGIWILGLSEGVEWGQLLMVALAGSLLGLVGSALIRRRLVEESQLEYPIGVAAAQTLQASQVGGATAVKLFSSMAFAGVWSVARDVMAAIPTMLFSLPISGVAFGLYNSPMLLSVGFLVGGVAVAFWFAGALFANFGIIVAGSQLSLWDMSGAQGIASSLGMGLMMGSGLGVVVRDILPQLVASLRAGREKFKGGDSSHIDGENLSTGDISRSDAGVLALLVAAASLLISLGLGLGPLVTMLVVLLGFVTTIMSAQSVGQTGIDPMEIFGLIVLLAVAAICKPSQLGLICVAAIVAVACGLGGDVMNDFKTGHILGTNPRSMWVGQAIGALLGCLVSVAVLMLLLNAYGNEAFGPGKLFVSAQASVVASMLSGIASVPAFAVGIVAGILLYCLKLPAMMLGLGVYLPFYMSFTAAVGALIKFAYDRLGAHIASHATETSHEDSGIIVASGVLGGESIVGVIIALATMLTSIL